MMKVKPLWCLPSEIPVEDRLDIFMHCEPKVATRCINTRFMKKVAQVTGRAVRKVNTLKGYANWSECVHGDWHMFRAPLTLAYAAKIDKFDAGGPRFQLPLTAGKAFGPVEHKGLCGERVEETTEDPTILALKKAERKKKHGDRIRSGAHTPRSKFREPQKEAVEARLAA